MNKYSTHWITTKNKILWTVLLTVFISISVSAEATASNHTLLTQEKVSVQKEMTVKELFTLLRNKSEYQFFYNADLEELNQTISIDLGTCETDILETLNKALGNTSLEYSVKGTDILIRKKVKSAKYQKQNKKHINSVKAELPARITGTVVDEDDMPMGGVAIIIKGTQKGTTTDFDGNYFIDAEPENELVFSYMGYQTETIKVGNQSKINLKMKPSSKMLDEVIIAGVASGTSKKKMSVSVTKVKAEQLNMASQSSIASALTGKIAGASISSFSGSPGSGSKIVLRGAKQLNGDSSLLVILDGVITSESLADINVDDIESSEIVKGAAASAMYGSKAANGVIVITSKRGKNLKKNQLSITLRNKASMQQVAKYLDLSQSHPYELALDWLSVDNYTKYNFVDYPANFDGAYNPNVTGERVIKADAYMDLPYRVNHDFQRELFTNGVSYTNYVGMGYKGNKTNVFLSLENFGDQGVVIETGGYKRNSVRLNVDYRLNDKFKFSISNNFIKTSNDFMGGGTGAFFNVLMMEPDANIYKDNPDGQKYYYFPSQYTQIVHNPLYDLWRKESNSKKTRYLGNINANWKINDWVSFKNEFSIATQDYESMSLTPKGTYDGLSDGILTKTTRDRLSDYTSEKRSQTFRSTLNFKQKWNELKFNGKLSYLYENNTFNTLSQNSDNDYGLPKSYPVVAKNFFAITSFVYKDRYILDALYRRDGSSLFGENERWQNYYRVSSAYRVTEDVKLPGIQELKLRLAYGIAGLRPGFSYQYETFTVTSSGDYVKENLGNKNLKPSKAAELEFGIDASFLKRFYLEATYSQTETTDQFVLKPLAPMFGGFKFQWVNDGTVTSESYEAMLQAKIIKKKDLKWKVNLTFNKVNSRISHLGVPEFSTGPRGAFRIAGDEEYGNMYGWDFVRTLDQMQAQLPAGDNIDEYVVNKDGVVVKKIDVGTVNEHAFHVLDDEGNNKIVNIGNVTPDFNLSVTNSVHYKGFTFYMLWKWKQGGDIYNATAQYLVRDLRHPMMDQIHTKPEDKKTVNYYQSLYDADALNGFWVEDGTYLKLGEASISYNLKFKKDSKIAKYVKRMKIGLSGTNLLTFSNYSGYDPEAGYSGYTFDNYGYPNFRKYTLSVEFKY